MSTIEERRLEFIRILEEVVPEKEELENFIFDMATWFDPEPMTDPDGNILPEDFCGTSACAWGSYALFSPLAEEDGIAVSAFTGPTYDGLTNPMESARMYFGMEFEDAVWLLDGGYIHREDVIARAKEMWGIG